MARLLGCLNLNKDNMSRSKIKFLNNSNFSDIVFTQKELTIVQFHDEENASSQLMDNVFQKLQEFYADNIICYTVCKSEASEIWEQYKIFKTPSYIFIKEKETVEKICGLISYDNFKAIINSCI